MIGFLLAALRKKTLCRHWTDFRASLSLTYFWNIYGMDCLWFIDRHLVEGARIIQSKVNNTNNGSNNISKKNFDLGRVIEMFAGVKTSLAPISSPPHDVRLFWVRLTCAGVV